MNKLSIILLCVLVALAACTKSKEVHPELGDGNDEILTVGATTAHVEYIRADIADLSKVVFHYSLTETQPFEAATMTKKEGYFELALNNLLSDTLYHYYYELFPNNGNATLSGRKTFHTMASNIPEPMVEVPTVRTGEVTDITANTAKCSGEVINDGGGEVTERGICWSTYENPTVNDNHVAVGEGTGNFTETINGLEANTTYHVRAYATNEKGTAYGLDKEFATISGGGNGDAPIGAINGLFTINASGDQVYFSQGNLQYQASTNTWRFAENQWDYVGTQIPDEEGDMGGNVNGSDNHFISSTYTGWIDLFGWGTSGFDHGAVCYQPWSTSFNHGLYRAYGHSYYNLFDQTGQADWGYNAIVNGGNIIDLWRTLVHEEWEYVFFTRNTTSGIRFAKAQVNGVNGMILTPDNWNSGIFPLVHTNRIDQSYSSNLITITQWNVLENAGAVFLPSAGIRREILIMEAGSAGNYWSASNSPYSNQAWYWAVNDSGFGTSLSSGRSYGLSVRLVQDANR